MITLESLLNNDNSSNINDTISLEDYSFELSNYTMECSDIMCEINTLEAASIVCEGAFDKIKNVFKIVIDKIVDAFKRIITWIKTVFDKTIGKLIVEFKKKTNDKKRKKIQENLSDILKSIEEVSSNNKFESAQSFEAYRDDPEDNKNRIINAGRRSFSNTEVNDYKNKFGWSKSRAYYDMISEELIQMVRGVLESNNKTTTRWNENQDPMEIVNGAILCSESGDEAAYKLLKEFDSTLKHVDGIIKDINSNMGEILSGEFEDYEKLNNGRFLSRTDLSLIVQSCFENINNLPRPKDAAYVANYLVKVYAEKGLNHKLLEEIQKFETSKMSGIIADLIGRYREISKTVSTVDENGNTTYSPDIANIKDLQKLLSNIENTLTGMNQIVNRLTMVYGRKLNIFNIIDKYVSDK